MFKCCHFLDEEMIPVFWQLETDPDMARCNPSSWADTVLKKIKLILHHIIDSSPYWFYTALKNIKMIVKRICTSYWLYIVLIVHCIDCTPYWLYTVLIIHRIDCTLYWLYTALIVYHIGKHQIAHSAAINQFKSLQCKSLECNLFAQQLAEIYLSLFTSCIAQTWR